MKRVVVFLLIFSGVGVIGFSQPANKPVVAFLHALDFVRNDSVAMISLDSISKKELTVKQQLEVNIRILTRANFLQQFEKAVAVANKSLDLAKKNNIDSMVACFHEQLGNTYYYMDNRPKAIEHYKMGVEVAEKKDEFWETQAASCNNMGAAYIDDKDYKNGEKYMLRALGLMMSHGKENDPNTHRTRRIIATLYSQTNRAREAEAMYLNSIAEARKNRDTATLTGNLIFYSTFLGERHDSLKAVEASAEALRYLRLGSDFHSLVSGMNAHSKNLAQVGRTKEAYQLMAESNTTLQKSHAKDLNRQISEMEVKYKTEQIKREKAQAEENARKEKQVYMVSFIGLLLAMAGIAFYVHQRRTARLKIETQKQRMASVIEGEEKERERIARDLHDGIVQDLTAIRLKLGGSGDEALAGEIDRAAREIRGIAYQMMPLALKESGLVHAIEDLLQKMLGPKDIRYEFEVVDLNERLPEKIELCLYRVVQELLNNVIKHSKASFVSIVISKRGGFVSLIFEDNGTGFDPATGKKGIGMSSLNTRLDMIDGKLQFETAEGSGTTAIVKIPLH